MNNQNGEPSMPLQCACGQKWSATMPTPETINSAYHSVVVVSHPKLIRCSNALCRAPFVLTVVPDSVQLAYEAVQLTEEQAQVIEGSPIIKPSILGGN